MTKPSREPRRSLNAKITARRERVRNVILEAGLQSNPRTRRSAERLLAAQERQKPTKRKPRSRLIYGSERAKAAAAVGVDRAQFRKEYKATFGPGPGRLRARHQRPTADRPNRKRLQQFPHGAPTPWEWRRAVQMPSRADKVSLDADYATALAKRDRKDANRDRCWTGARGQLKSSAGDHHA